VGVVVPIRREVERLPQLVERFRSIRERTGWDVAVLFVADAAEDGSAALAQSLGLPWVRLVVRPPDRAAGQAVLEGLSGSAQDVLVVMDADLRHPPEAIPELVRALDAGADFAVGSPFVEGGGAEGRSPLRRLERWVATALARPLTPVKDPTSGFFALRRSTFLGGSGFSPVGHALGLELFVRCRCARVEEVPVRLEGPLGERGRSAGEWLRYLQHLRRLCIHKFGTWSHAFQFGLVGLSGVAVNLALLTLFLALGARTTAAVPAAIALSMIWNFALNRRFTFSYARDGNVVRQFLGFVSTCLLGALVNAGVTLLAWDWFHTKQLAAVIGVLAGMGLNFLGSRYVVFRAARRPPERP
jgi:dolichol-phosphate mannosyltransferase